MLKIKDNVDLIKLVLDYGWNYDEYAVSYYDKNVVPYYYKNFEYYNTLYIGANDRRIMGIHDETISISKEKIIEYGWIDDLIKDGLVEKVKE